MLDLNKITDIEFGGINHSDYPDYCDAYVTKAFYPQQLFPFWRILTDDELNWLNEQRDFVYEKLIEHLY